MRIIFPSLLFQIFVDNFVYIQCFIGNVLIEVSHSLETEAFNEAHHDSFIIFYFPVFEFPFNSFFGKGMLAGNHLFQSLAYLGTCFGGSHDVQPVLLRCLGIRGHDFYLITTVQYLTKLRILAINFCTDTLASQFTMDMKSKIQHCGTFT